MTSINMGSVWDRATEFLGDNIAVVMPIALALIFLPASIGDNIAALGARGTPMQLPISLLNLALAMVSVIGQLAVIALAVDAAEAARGALQIAAGRVIYALLFSIILITAIVAGLLPIVIAFAASGANMAGWMANLQAGTPIQGAALPVGLAWFIIIYTLLWVAGAAWLSARLALGFPVMVAEQRGLSAFARSYVLTKGLVLKIIGVLVLYLVVSLVAALSAKAAFGAVARLLIGDGGPMGLASVLTSIAVGAVGMAFTVLQAAFVAKLYVAARSRGQENAFSQ